MPNIFQVRIDQLQPSQPFLSEARLNNILSCSDFLCRPVGVRELNGKFCVVEGHERLYVLHSIGKEFVNVYVDESGKDMNIWQQCVEITMSEGVACINDFESRIVSPSMFMQLWLSRKLELAK